MGEKREGFGRPPIPIDPSKLEGMLMYGATQWECAAEFECSEDTIVNFVKEHYLMTFSDLRAIHFGKTQLRIKQAQIRSALGSQIKRTVMTKRRVRRRRKEMDGTYADETAEELIPQTVYEDVPPDTKMLIWLGKQLLGQSEEAKIDQDLEQLRARFEKPTVRIEVQNSDGTVIQQLEHKWSDQAQLQTIDAKPSPVPNGQDHTEAKQEDDLDDLLETDS